MELVESTRHWLGMRPGHVRADGQVHYQGKLYQNGSATGANGRAQESAGMSQMHRYLRAVNSKYPFSCRALGKPR